ncbi:MAG: lipid-A-disaccharide synthase, partial [Tannerella sp.]|nr:lipid-A-disaccharide synthase [Tannerella sp.]
VIAGAPGLAPDDYKRFIAGNFGSAIVYGQTYDLLRHADVALVTSGTATLETALFRVPQVVCYYVNGGKLTSFVFNRFFHIPFISLVNLIAGKEVVKELFGGDFTSKKVFEELKRIVEDPEYKRKMLEGYDSIIEDLGKPGASARTAKLIVGSLLASEA